ncbi:MAG: hypothetical protein LBE76_02105 [Nitrososphaerota archaeon]|jgi:N-acetylneuraminic acid mutarotase|nr:hypothetical protein [Nitrososphaerota archaeon]
MKINTLYKKATSPNKIFIPILLFIIIIGLFTAVFSFVSAQKLVEDSWTTKTPLNEARYNMGTVVVDGKIYAIGGSNGDRQVGTNERYDPKTDTWTTLTPIPKIGFTNLVAYQNKIYCIGSTFNNANNTYLWVEVYDIATDSWDSKSSTLFNQLGIAQACVVDGKIYVAARLSDGSLYVFDNYKVDMHMYDPTTDTWTTKTGIYEKQMIISDLFVLDNKIAAILLPDQTNQASQGKILTYDPNTDKWQEKATTKQSMPMGTIGVTKGIYAPQKIYFFLNYNDISIQVYDFASDTLTSVADMKTLDGVNIRGSRSGFSVVNVDDVFYVIGGLTNYTAVAANIQYVPIGYQDTLASTFPLTDTVFVAILATLVIVIVAIGLLHFKSKHKTNREKAKN